MVMLKGYCNITSGCNFTSRVRFPTFTVSTFIYHALNQGYDGMGRFSTRALSFVATQTTTSRAPFSPAPQSNRDRETSSLDKPCRYEHNV